MLSTYLRKLTPDELSSYSASALLTVGDVADYMHFLPRIIEISVTEDCWWPDVEVTGRAIRNTDPRSWSRERFKAFDQLLHVQIDSLLSSDDSGAKIDSWICAICKMGLDVRPFLKRIESSPFQVLDWFRSETVKEIIN